MRLVGHGDEAIVAGAARTARVLRGPLRGFDDPEEAAGHDDARHPRLVHQHQHVHGVAVLAERDGNEAEIEREDATRREHLVEQEDAAAGVELELVGAATLRLDDG